VKLGCVQAGQTIGSPRLCRAAELKRGFRGDTEGVEHIDSCRLAPQTNSLAKLWVGPRLVAGKWGVGNFISGHFVSTQESPCVTQRENLKSESHSLTYPPWLARGEAKATQASPRVAER
jgi:hypothetical protein